MVAPRHAQAIWPSALSDRCAFELNPCSLSPACLCFSRTCLSRLALRLACSPPAENESAQPEADRLRHMISSGAWHYLLLPVLPLRRLHLPQLNLPQDQLPLGLQSFQRPLGLVDRDQQIGVVVVVA